MSLVSPIDATLDGVVWKKTAEEVPEVHPRPTEDLAVDLVVVGAGYCGLTTALRAAEAGLSVAVLEAGVVGGGASGRNGGFVVPHFPGGITPAGVEQVLGRRKGAALTDLVLNGADKLFATVADQGIQCHATQNGWIQPAHSRRALERVRAVYEGWRALGAPVRWLDEAEVAHATGAAGYLGGWTNPSGGTVNPYSLAVGLARACVRHGVRFFERSPAEGFEAGAGGTAVLVNGRRIMAKTVIVAVNGYADASVPAVQRSAVPVYLFHVATEPLPEPLRASVLPGRSCFTDLRKSGGFGRLDSDGRLISGGAVFTFGNRKAYALRHVKRRIGELFPSLATARLKIETYWEGYCSVTDSYLPHVQVLGDRIFAVGGFSTRGVNLSQGIGRMMGDFAAGRMGLDDVPIAVLDRRRDVPYWSVKTRVARVIFPVFQAKDRLGLT